MGVQQNMGNVLFVTSQLKLCFAHLAVESGWEMNESKTSTDAIENISSDQARMSRDESVTNSCLTSFIIFA